MCLQRTVVDETAEEPEYDFTLESHNFAYAEDCKDKLECICNTDETYWVTNEIIGNYVLPDPLLVPIPHYE